MGAQVFEYWGRGPQGVQAMGHLVRIGAHSPHGRGPALRPVKRHPSVQGDSWYALDSEEVRDGHPLIAQIHFPTGNSSLDLGDDVVWLDRLVQDMVGYLDLTGGQQLELEFIGHADRSGAAGFNEKLARRRAERVASHVENGIKRASVGKRLLHSLRFRPKVTSAGERLATGISVYDRRVDVVLRSVPAVQQQNFSGFPTMVDMRYRGALTRKLQFRGWGGFSVGVFKVIGAEVQELEIRNPNTGKSAFYFYLGANVSTPSPIPVGVSPPDAEYTQVELPDALGYVDIEDFAGSGGCGSVGAGKSGSLLVFNGPKLHHAKKVLRDPKGWQVTLEGVNIAVPGGSVGGGRWVRATYSTVAEREQKHREAEERRQKFQDRGPKL